MKRLLAFLHSLFVGKDPKTSAAAIVGVTATVLAHFHIAIPADLQMPLMAATVYVIGRLAQDGTPAAK
jgi:hypothetical protein